MGVAREVLEKTGIHAEVDELTGVYKNTTRGIVALVFRCKPSGGTERTSTESTAVEWLTPGEGGITTEATRLDQRCGSPWVAYLGSSCAASAAGPV
ncbi:hypothetical protein GCM10014715_88920 [Streptomyces spiralis]|uniref:Nudix hydrolase domain-containing protein n=1 Tax=Streptomyces spiralis TaxID=66376 RepID=A0A919ASL3_9ACTN|nr:hypothetical protein GCM10014715_88920 [Streptomyces spiralis]